MKIFEELNFYEKENHDPIPFKFVNKNKNNFLEFIIECNLEKRVLLLYQSKTSHKYVFFEKNS